MPGNWHARRGVGENVELSKQNVTYHYRNQIIIDVPEPSDNELMARIKSMTGYKKSEHSYIDLPLFLKIYKELKAVAKTRRLDDGIIGPRKLADWVSSTMITKDPELSANFTILPGATTDSQALSELKEKLKDRF